MLGIMVGHVCEVMNLAVSRTLAVRVHAPRVFFFLPVCVEIQVASASVAKE
jgi:hypothetical protein